MCSTNSYSRQEAVAKLRTRKWFGTSSVEIQQQLINLPSEYDGFVNDMSDRTDTSMEFELLKLTEIHMADSLVMPVFLVKSNFSGKTYERTFTTYRRGRHHALRGLVLLEKDGVISHFLVRKCSRFEVNKVVYESLGSIYAPIILRDEPQMIADYVQNELSKLLRVPKLNSSRFINLGNVNPDGSVVDMVIGLYASVIKVDNVESLRKLIENKEYDDKGYVYSFEILPIDELLNFLGKTDDSYLLSIFGRLQALNIIKL